MKREITVLILLFALITASLLNIKFLNNFSTNLCTQIDSIKTAAASKEFDQALDSYEKTFELWDENKVYYGIFLRHPEIDSSYDCFYELKAELLSKESETIPAICDKLKYHIQCLANMESLKLSSIL